ncbi:hypothetical protein [Niabella hibiscisoli]|uniref:hypothetical protein n=1 Tax=Niabella hibiscisoli TaxID=1825928 RepID=UPI001F0EF4B1|nr:hypothetical protein [Niabella hibiscisoli]MCH5720808.1 hypothetical protein [Niabella hibiscisoli]
MIKQIIRNEKNILIPLCSILVVLLVMNSGCKKLFGLERQKSWDFEPVVLDPHINRTAWQFLKDYATGPTRQDSVFTGCTRLLFIQALIVTFICKITRHLYFFTMMQCTGLRVTGSRRIVILDTIK